jgi:hypothetical protein
MMHFYRRGGAGQRNYAGLFAGAACCHPIELPRYKAAPLQELGTATPADDVDETPLIIPFQEVVSQAEQHFSSFTEGTQRLTRFFGKTLSNPA